MHRSLRLEGVSSFQWLRRLPYAVRAQPEELKGTAKEEVES